MIRYVHILDTDGKRYFLRVSKETALAITGVEVDEDGEEIVPRAAAPDGRRYHNRIRVVTHDAIVRMDEMRMNNRYATLEPYSGES